MNATHSNAGIASWRFNLKAEIGSYEDCAGFVAERVREEGAVKTPEQGGHALRFTARGGESYDYELGPKMRLVMKADCYAIVLYDTEIIRYYPDGTFSVDNGGFNTPTTAYRLSAVLPDNFYNAFHHQKQLGLRHKDGRWPTRGKVQPEGVLWPLDHSIRIDPTTGKVVA